MYKNPAAYGKFIRIYTKNSYIILTKAIILLTTGLYVYIMVLKLYLKGAVKVKIIQKVFNFAVCAAAVVFSFTGCTNYSKMMNEKPQEYLSIASENAAKAMLKDSGAEVYDLFEEAAKNGSFTVEFEAEGIKFKGEGYSNEKDGMTSQMYTLTGSEGTSAQAYVYADNGTAKFGTIGNSGTHIYSIDFDTVTEKIGNSIFAPGSGSSYALSQEEFDMIVEYLGEIDAAVKGEAADGKNAVYQDIIASYIESHPPVVEEKAETTVAGETVTANIITYDIPKEDIRSVALQIFDAAAANGEFDETIESNKYWYGDDYSIDDYKEEFTDQLDDYSNYGINAVYKVNSKTNALMQFDITANMADDYMNIVIKLGAVLGADPENSANSNVYCEVNTDYSDDDEYDSNIRIDADITSGENSSDMTIKMDKDGETTELAKINCTKDGDNYTLTADIPEAEITAKAEGTISADSKEFKMTVDRVSLVSGSTEVSYLPKIVITVKKGGEILALDAEKEFLDITEEELDALGENIENDFMAVLDEFAEGSVLGESMTNYVRKSKISSANANAKTVYTALAVQLTEMAIDGETVKGSVIEGNGTDISIGGKKYDLSDYLGDEFSGYFYGECDPDTYSANYVLWSKEPIPDQYMDQISRDEQESLADDDVYIGCYPIM